ncbi:hypothetical protein [Geomonas sp.]|nr:hypothetical protein [Geomonas sp.]HJV34000.1 hypothetical protein [Geomonas sp.]
MRRTLQLVLSMLLMASMLSGCIVVPLWGDGGYEHHHGHGYYGRR